MNATKILMSEHRVIERVITSIEMAAEQVNIGKAVPPEFFLQAAEFIKGFADGCHHKKEEGVLFREMTERGFPSENGPVAVMLFEHEQGRAFTRGMRAAAERWQGGDLSAKKDVTDNALGYAALLRQHIQKEDTILFPMADKFIPADAYDEVEEAFERVEHEETGEGVHEKYLALAESLEKAVAVI